MIRDIDLSVFVKLGDQLTAPLRDVEGTIAKASERMNKRLALSMKLAGGGAAAGIVAEGARRLVTGFTDSIRDVERAKGELATLGVRDLDAVVRRGREMQMELAGVTADAFVRASYDIKSGISSLSDQGVAEMTAAAMVTAKATRGIPEQMTSLFATSYGIFKDQYAIMSDADFGNMFGAALSASVKQFKTDGAAMQQAIESAGSGAVNIGMKMTEQLTLLGMMQQTMQAGEAGTALRAFATNAAKAHESFADLADESGNPIRVRILDENGGLREMPDILADLKSRYGETLDAFEAAEIKEAFGTDEAMKMINALYGQEEAVRANAEALDEAAGRGAEFTAEMARAADNNWDAAMVLMSQKMNVLQQMIGERLLPVVQRLTPYIDAFITSAFQWIDANPELITGIGTVVVGLGAMAAIIAPILLATSTLVSGWAVMSYGATRLGLTVFKLGKWVGGAGKWLMWLGRVVLPLVGKAVIWIGRALIANPIGAIIMGIATMAFLLYKYWEPISAFFADLWSTVSGVMVSAWEGIKGWFQGFRLVRIIMQNWDGIVGFFVGLWSRIKSGVTAGWELIKSLFFNYTPLGLVITHWDGIVGFFAGLWENIKAGVAVGWELIKSTFMAYHPLGLVITHWDTIVGFFAGLWDLIALGISAGWAGIKVLFFDYTPAGMIYTHWDGLVTWFGSLWDRVKARFASAWVTIKADVATWPASMFTYGAQLIDQMIAGIVSRIPGISAVMRGVRNSVDPNAIMPGISSRPLSPEEDPNQNPARNQALLDLYGTPPVQKRAGGGGFGPGWLMTGEQGPELEYRSRGGYIAHNGALQGMIKMASRARELAQGIDFGSFGLGASPVPAMATVAAAGGGAGQRGPITLSPQYNMPLSFAAGVDMDEVRATVRDALADAEERAMAAMRGLLHD